MTSNPDEDARHTAPLRRLTEGRERWRVLVETWYESDEVRGRLLFHPEAARPPQVARESSAMLHGRSREDVVAAAHELTEDRLRRVLHSLG
jgi:hypothetical protein